MDRAMGVPRMTTWPSDGHPLPNRKKLPRRTNPRGDAVAASDDVWGADNAHTLHPKVPFPRRSMFVAIVDLLGPSAWLSPPEWKASASPRRLGPGGDRRPANAVAISVTRVAYPRRRQMFVLAREGDQPLRPPHALPILHRPPLHPPKHATTVDGQSRGCLNWGSKEIPANRQKVRRRDHSPTCVSWASPFGPIMIRAPLTLTISMQDQLSPRRANARTRRKPEPRLPSREQEQRKPKDKLKCR